MVKRGKQKNNYIDNKGEIRLSTILYPTLIIFVVFILIPNVSNLLLRTVLESLKPFALMFVFFLLVKTAFGYSTAKKKRRDSLLNIKVEPIALKPLLNHTANYQRPSVKEQTLGWSIKLIQDLEWKRFEELSVAYYLQKGIRAETTPLGADGGIDIKLYQDESGKPTTIVQCKAWSSNVGVKQIREFLGVMTHEKIAKGFYMTSSEYSEDAKKTAIVNKITLINGEMLLMMIKRLSEDSQEKLLSLATKGDYKTPTCASCGIKMVRRSGSRGEFWGCTNYPRCKQMLNLRKIDQE